MSSILLPLFGARERESTFGRRILLLLAIVSLLVSLNRRVPYWTVELIIIPSFLALHVLVLIALWKASQMLPEAWGRHCQVEERSGTMPR